MIQFPYGVNFEAKLLFKPIVIGNHGAKRRIFHQGIYVECGRLIRSC